MTSPWLTLLLLCATACSSAPAADGAPVQSFTRAEPTSDEANADAPGSCNGQGVREVVEDFLRAMNDGDASAAEALVAPSLRFGWFSVDPERLGADSKDRSTLGAFLVSRVEAQEQIELVEFDVTAYRAQDRTGHFAFGLAQSSSDYADSTTIGKGAIDCDTGLIIVWTVGSRQ